MLKENFSGLVGVILSSLVIVISENDALEIFDVIEDVFPEFIVFESENAVAFLIESEPVKDTFGDDEGIVFFAAESVEP